LVSRVCVYDATYAREKYDLGDCNGPKGFGEVFWFTHFGDEGREGDLTDEGVGDVEKGVEAVDKGDAFYGDGGDDWVAFCNSIARRMFFNPGENGGKDDRNKCEKGRGRA